jgi:hypothetical protein
MTGETKRTYRSLFWKFDFDGIVSRTRPTADANVLPRFQMLIMVVQPSLYRCLSQIRFSESANREGFTG